jgi:hypothetical protein
MSFPCSHVNLTLIKTHQTQVNVHLDNMKLIAIKINLLSYKDLLPQNEEAFRL